MWLFCSVLNTPEFRGKLTGVYGELVSLEESARAGYSGDPKQADIVNTLTACMNEVSRLLDVLAEVRGG